MTSAAHRCHVGVLSFQGRVYTYELLKNGWAARDDRGHPCEVSDELRTAIEANEQYQRSKHK